MNPDEVDTHSHNEAQKSESGNKLYLGRDDASLREAKHDGTGYSMR